MIVNILKLEKMVNVYGRLDNFLVQLNNVVLSVKFLQNRIWTNIKEARKR